MNKSAFQKRVDWLFFIPGFCTTMFGVRSIIFSDFGASSVDTVSVGLYQIFGFTIGVWANVISAFVLLLGMILSKKVPNIISIVLSFSLGLLLDLYSFLLFDRLDPAAFSPFALFLFFVGGVICMGIGIGTYLVPNIGAAAVEFLTLGMCQKFNINVVKARMIIDFVMALVGYLIGGPFGLGTVLMIFGLGPLIGFFNSRAQKIYDNIRSREYA